LQQVAAPIFPITEEHLEVFFGVFEVRRVNKVAKGLPLICRILEIS